MFLTSLWSTGQSFGLGQLDPSLQGSLLCLPSPGGSPGGLPIQVALTQCVAVGRLSVGAAGAIGHPGGWLTQAPSCGGRVPGAAREDSPPLRASFRSPLCHLAASLAKARPRPAQVPGVEKDLPLEGKSCRIPLQGVWLQGQEEPSQ